jgi:hypothetical protein
MKYYSTEKIRRRCKTTEIKKIKTGKLLSVTNAGFYRVIDDYGKTEIINKSDVIECSDCEIGTSIHSNGKNEKLNSQMDLFE